jgi:DNA-binding NarL/FixJ family response regulator
MVFDKIKIVLADDEILFRKAISFLLQKESNVEILFEASDGKELLELLEESEILPDIIIMDLKMPNLNGVEATKKIVKNYPDIKIIALTSYSSKCFINNMIEIGAASYLVKSATPKEVLETINEVHKKGFYYNETVLEVLENESITLNKSLEILFDRNFLSAREREILQHICKQLSTSEIAEKLFLSPRTVDGHRNNLLLKTKSKNMAGLVVFALQNNIISLDNLNFEE